MSFVTRHPSPDQSEVQKMLKSFFNSRAAEYQLVTVDLSEMTATTHPRRATSRLERDISSARENGLLVVAMALFNQTFDFSYSWPRWLESRHGFGFELEKTRRASREYHGLIDVFLRPHPGARVYPVEIDYTTGRVKITGVLQ